jgi:hypothetical protein
MKRVFAFAVLAGLTAPLGAARAQDPAAPDAAQVQPGEQTPNMVKPEAPRGQLGGLASGAPGFADNVQQLRGRISGQAVGASAPAGAVAPGAAAGAPAATTVTTNTAIAETQTVAPANSHRLVRLAVHYAIRAELLAQGIPHEFLPIPHGVGFIPVAPHGAPVISDLELIGVGVVAEAIDEKGPIYRVTFRNRGLIPSHHFRVSLIAIHGELCGESPVMTVKIDHLAAGATGHIDVQMPCSIMAMGPKDQPVPFESLIAVVDSFDELIEDSELNNVTTFTRSQIAVIESTTATTAAPVAGAAAPAPVAAQGVAPAPAAGAPAPDAAPAPAAPQQAPPAAGGAPAKAPAPQQESILDQLDLEKAEGTAQLFVR